LSFVAFAVTTFVAVKVFRGLVSAVSALLGVGFHGIEETVLLVLAWYLETIQAIIADLRDEGDVAGRIAIGWTLAIL